MGFECGFGYKKRTLGLKIEDALDNEDSWNILEYYCSPGKHSGLDDFILANLDQVGDSECYIITEEFIDKLRIWVDQQYILYKPKNLYVTYGASCNDDCSITLKPINGIEGEDEDGELIRVDNDSDKELWVVKDSEKYYLFNSLMNLCNTMKILLEDELYYIWYYRSY